MFWHWNEEWPIMTKFAPIASDQLKKEQDTRPVDPRSPLLSRGVNFVAAAIRTGSPTNFQHSNNLPLQGFCHARGSRRPKPDFCYEIRKPEPTIKLTQAKAILFLRRPIFTTQS